MYDNFFHAKDLRKYHNWIGYRNEDDWNQLNHGHDDLVLDGSGVIMPAMRPDKTDDPCYLCRLEAKEITKVYFLCNDFIIIDCHICGVPIAISSYHSLNIIPAAEASMVRRLSGYFGNAFQFEKRTDINHLNWHVIRTDIDRENWEKFHEII